MTDIDVIVFQILDSKNGHKKVMTIFHIPAGALKPYTSTETLFSHLGRINRRKNIPIFKHKMFITPQSRSLHFVQIKRGSR